jgi:hypothetical protein
LKQPKNFGSLSAFIQVSFYFSRLLESSKSAIPATLYAERAVKLCALQTVIEELLEDLQTGQEKLSMETHPFQERSKQHVKSEQEKIKLETERKVTPKSLFHGTSSATSMSIMDTSVQSE